MYAQYSLSSEDARDNTIRGIIVNLLREGMASTALKRLDQAVESGDVTFPCGTNDSCLDQRFVDFLFYDESICDESDASSERDAVLASFKVNRPEPAEKPSSFPLEGLRGLIQRSIDGEHPLFTWWLHTILIPDLLRVREGYSKASCPCCGSPVDRDLVADTADPDLDFLVPAAAADDQFLLREQIEFPDPIWI